MRRRLHTSLVLLTALATLTLAPTAAHPASARPPGPGTNILVVGIDSRAGLSKAEKNRLNVGGKGCNCTDVMMLVHLSADERRASVVSIPRDSYVTYPEGRTPARSGKINGAYAIGGAPLTIRTVESVTGLHVDHYLETGFTGFEAAVNSLGGAVICTDNPLKDVNSGLDVTAGVHEVDGRGSLRYVRARHIGDNPGDLGRVRRQQRFVSDLLTRLTTRQALSSPLAAAHTAQTLLKSVRTDPATSLQDVVHLARALGRLTPRQREFATVPISDFDHRVPGAGSTLLWDQPRVKALWSALAADRPLTGDARIQPPSGTPARPESLQVRVDDEAVAQKLRQAGFQRTATSAAPATRHAGPPVIRYAPGALRGATTLATALPGARLTPVPGHDETFDIAIGTAPVTVHPAHYDRNTIDGSPTPGHRLACPPPR
ncbi:LCP family protein [Streptomyces sp. NPDC006656]|uniref:LCP family protein n=1 Tax=Streptomyces sp. NPDC006656 TaxID=3156899 RepID=UPI0034572413